MLNKRRLFIIFIILIVNVIVLNNGNFQWKIYFTFHIIPLPSFYKIQIFFIKKIIQKWKLTKQYYKNKYSKCKILKLFFSKVINIFCSLISDWYSNQIFVMKFQVCILLLLVYLIKSDIKYINPFISTGDSGFGNDALNTGS